MCVDDSGFAWLRPGIHRETSGQEGSMVGGEPEPELLLNPAEFRISESGVDRTDRSGPQPPHRFLPETTATVTLSIKRCVHVTRPYLAGMSRTRHTAGDRAGSGPIPALARESLRCTTRNPTPPTVSFVTVRDGGIAAEQHAR